MTLSCAKYIVLALTVAGAALGDQDAQYVADSTFDQLPVVAAADSTDRTNGQGCHQACESLAAIVGDDLVTHYGALPDGFAPSFYSLQQRELVPVCVAEPQTAEGVSLVVKAVRQFNCPFAIRSGGHSSALGTNNRHGGLTIDLKRLNQIEVSADNSTVSVGPGNTWEPIYKKLEPLGLVAVGGRVNSVGVGGFMVNGGISFLSPQYGWAADNVRNFEASNDTASLQVVLPNGTIANANPNSHPDIFFALRGGGSSFGIVTRFDLETHASHETFWGGSDTAALADEAALMQRLGFQDSWDWSHHAALRVLSRAVQRVAGYLGYGVEPAQLIAGYKEFVERAQSDKHAHAFIFASWVPNFRMYAMGTTYAYNKKVEKPKTLQTLTGVARLMSTARFSKLTEFTTEVTDMNIYEHRQYWRTATFKFSPDLIAKFWDIFFQESAPLRATAPTAVLSTNIQLITKEYIVQSNRNGGNPFGLKVEDAPLCILSNTMMSKDAKDDDAMQKLTERIMNRTHDAAEAMGLNHPFIYGNYAAADQNVYAGFAPESLKRLLKIQQRYDPGRIFASLQPEQLTLNEKRLNL